MPVASDRSVRLFYDESCGPCRFVARAAQAASRRRVVATPLDSPLANETLGALNSETRYAYAHLAREDELRTGEALVGPLVGLTLGRSWEKVVRRVPPIDRALRWIYRSLWEYRRTRGCGARATA